MIHCPCGKKNPKARYMYDADGILTDICHKSFPKNYRTETAWDDASSYATYRRRTPQDGGGEAQKDRYILDSSWVVPHNPYLLLRYNCHINVEICVSAKATKYLYKYIHKGGDRAMVRVDDDGKEQPVNKIREFQDVRQFGAAESTWRLFEFEMGTRYPAVVRLPIHLEN